MSTKAAHPRDAISTALSPFEALEALAASIPPRNTEPEVLGHISTLLAVCIDNANQVLGECFAEEE
ncbi:hypothetical protein [Desulfoferula mesophila]|uniref:Uncharacterized protein n=1 Tax=Desulfoferula mesophila TaxID=3058419 RepID=A0AAU9F2D3_9BACT|nr:hypothetical protein FAK_15680 [Desulfoferula mesophilus]